MTLIDLTPEEIEMSREYAARATLGGVSQIRAVENRAATVAGDNDVGMRGNLALHIWWFGRPAGVAKFKALRDAIDKDPWKGDGGRDLDGKGVDVKTSQMRYSQDPTEYRLIVRPRERHEGWVYIAAFVEKAANGKVYLAGWANDAELPQETETVGSLAGAHVLLVPELRAMDNLRRGGWCGVCEGKNPRCMTCGGTSLPD